MEKINSESLDLTKLNIEKLKINYICLFDYLFIFS